MKKVFFLNILITTFIFGQKINVVKYSFINNDKEENIEQLHFLIFNEKELYYITPAHKKYENYNLLLNDEEYQLSNKYMTFLYSNYNDNSYLGTGYAGGNKLILFEDVFDNINWNISNEKKEILGFQCQSAVGKFRGREYKVWFTSSIPNYLGPWKLKGLPGLILEGYDKTKQFSFVATSIELNKNTEIPNKLIKYLNVNKQNSIPYREYIELENSRFIEYRNRATASLPRNTIFEKSENIRKYILEKSFEWESD